MQLSKPLVSCVRFQQSLRSDMDTGILEQPKIVLFPVAKGQTDDFAIFEIYQHLGL